MADDLSPQTPLPTHPMPADPIERAAALLDGQIDFYAGRCAGASKIGADLLAMRACRAALAVHRGEAPCEDDAASLAQCSMVRARTVLSWLASTWRTTPYGFRHRNWTAWAPLNLLLTGPGVVNVFGQPDPPAMIATRRAPAKPGMKSTARRSAKGPR
jgi:hypothetical protein